MRRFRPFLRLLPVLTMLFASLAPVPVWAALSATTVIEVETVGSDSANSGLFDPGQVTSASNHAFTDLTTNAGTGNTSAPVVSSASYNFNNTTDASAWLYVSGGGTFTAGWYKISSCALNKATLDAAIGHAVLANGTPSTVVGIATTGTPTSGIFAIDYSQQAAVVWSYTDITCAGAGLTATSAGHPFGRIQVGNSIVATGGTNINTGRYVLASVSGTTGTFVGPTNLSSGASSDGAGGMGGALASPGMAGSVMVAGNWLFAKSGTYSVTSATTNISGGCLSLPSSSSTSQITRMCGYNSVRGDYSTRPLLQASGISTFTLIALGSYNHVENVSVDGASLTSSRGLNMGANASGRLYKCKAANFTNNGIIGSSTSQAILCEATGCSTNAAISSTSCFGCSSYSNIVTGNTPGSGNVVIDSLSVNNSGATSDGFSVAAACLFINSTAYNNGRNGFNLTSAGTFRVEGINCISYGNASFGYTVNASTQTFWLFNCAGGSNSTNVNTSISFVSGFITLTASPFVNAAGGNYLLNTLPGGGALLRGKGIPGAFPGISTTGYMDIGAVPSTRSAVVVRPH